MALTLRDLTPEVRKHMISEIQSDIDAGKLYISPRLSVAGSQKYPQLLIEAATNHNDAWLASQLSPLFNATETRKTKSGTTQAKVPSNANTLLAEGEFNRFYIRGLCRVAIESSQATVTAYRARYSENPRPESEALIGRKFDATTLLNDLRVHTGVDTALGLPPGPNSGISASLK